MPRRRRHVPDPLIVLGLPPNATLDDVDAARRALAKSAHPDVGGSVADMQRINAAADEAARRLTGGRAAQNAPTGDRPSADQQQGGGSAGSAGSARGRDPGRPRYGRTDHPSFTIDALPVEAFEALLIVAGWLGDLIDDEPPYALEVALTHPIAGWCRLDLVPDAGSSTVSVTVAGVPGASPPDIDPPDIDTVRDAWIEGLNQLDWTDLDGSRQQP